MSWLVGNGEAALCRSRWREHMAPVAMLLVAIFSAFGAVHFLFAWKSVAWLPRPAWLVLLILCALGWNAARAWRYQEPGMSKAVLRRQIAWRSLTLLSVSTCVLNLLPKAYLQTIEHQTRGYIQLAALVQDANTLASKIQMIELTECLRWRSKTAEREPSMAVATASGEYDPCEPKAKRETPGTLSSTTTDYAKEVQESINRWGTLFAWLLAAAAVVMTVITGWVLGLLKEGKEQLAAAKNELNLRAQHRQIQLELDTTKCEVAVIHLWNLLDDDKAPNWRKVVVLYRKLLGRITEMHSSRADVDELAKLLKQDRETLKAGSRVLETDIRCSAFSREEFALCLGSHVDSLRDEPHMQGNSGRDGMRSLTEIIRLVKHF